MLSEVISHFTIQTQSKYIYFIIKLYVHLRIFAMTRKNK